MGDESLCASLVWLTIKLMRFGINISLFEIYLKNVFRRMVGDSSYPSLELSPFGLIKLK